MSFSEVEMGLPPVNVVTSPTPSTLSQQQGRLPPSYEEVETDTPQSSMERISTHPKKNDRFDVFRVPPPPPPVVRSTNDSSTPSPPPRTTSVDQERVYALEESDQDEPPDDEVSRARRYGGFVLILLPGVFGALAVQFIKYMLDYHHVYVLSLCIFQGILWSSVFFIIYASYWMKRNVLESISCENAKGWRNMAEITILSILATVALVLQIVSLLHIDITVSLAISFTPLIFAGWIEHISLQKRCSLELLFTSFIAYSGLIVLSMSVVTTGDRNLLVGIGTAVGSMTLAIPVCLLLSRLRRNEVEDTVTATIFAFVGTLLSLLLMGAYLTFGVTFSAFSRPIEAHPGYIASLVAFVLCATFFLILDSIYRSASPTSTTARVVLNIPSTRMGVFLFSGIWEILKRGIYPGYYSFPSVFSIFGVILIMVACGLTIGYQAWYKQVVIPQLENKDKNDDVIGKPFTFFPWLFSRSFV